MVIRDVLTILPPRWKTGTGYVKMQDIKKEAERANQPKGNNLPPRH
jgi:hypothetical protein